MSDLELSGLTKRFDETVAVDDVSLAIEDGETLGLVGPSGCGKTTTLRMVAGFETPEEGAVLFDGVDVTTVPPESRNVGLVFQSYALFDNMTVRENVEFGLKMRDIEPAARRERAAELLELLGIGELADRDPTTLSGGQQQRVGLARALAIEPDVLLLDEPMTGLDAKLKRRLRVEVGELLADLDVTALYVTHDQEEAMVMCDRIAVMNEGRVEQVGEPAAVYESPENAFVADFVGSANLLTGEADGGAVDLGFTRLPVDAEGDEVTVSVRPSGFEVGGDDVEASVVTSDYLGDRTRVVASLPTDERVTVETDATADAPAPGERVGLSVDPGAAHVVDSGRTDGARADGGREES